jgi:hypothetical protein
VPQLIPVFLNGTPLRVPAGSTLGQLLAEHDPDLLAALLGGSAVATDARDIVADPDAALSGGAIFRVRRSSRTPEPTDA